MTFEEFLAEVRVQETQHPDWRAGRALFNTLLEVRPAIAEILRATPSDPFHAPLRVAPRYQSALRVIEAHWYPA